MKFINGRLIQQSVSRYPLNVSDSVSVAASSSGSVKIDVSDGEIWYIKSLTITKGSNSTINNIAIDGNSTGYVDTVSDVESEFGALLSAEAHIQVDVSNAGTASEDTEIVVKGFRMR